jgi:dedicator of cytokinesis protein 3
MAGKILGLCLSSHDATCEAAVEILFSMIYAEYVLHGRFGGIQTEIFAKLDELVSRGAIRTFDYNWQFAMKGSSSATVSDPTSRAYFVAQLRAVFEASPPVDPTFQTEVGRFMDEIELFIDLLITLRTLPEAPEWKDERTLAVHRLTGFTQRIGRTDLYIRFIHQLVDIALESKDHLGAGYALRLHADVYDWNVSGDLVDEFAGSGLELPAQTQFERKEALLYHAMDHFGKCRTMHTLHAHI